MKQRYGFYLVPLVFPPNDPQAVRIDMKIHDWEDCADWLWEHGIEQAELTCNNLEMLEHLDFIRYLRIIPTPDSVDFDFSPLYQMPEVLKLVCENQYGKRRQHISTIDYSQISGLQDLSVSVNKGTLNFNRVKTLRSLHVVGFTGKNKDLSDLFCSRELDTLSMIQCKNTSLDGIDISEKMQCVYLSHNRSLEDISALRNVKHTLRALRIENCPQITDFSVLRELENLELLSLEGKNVLASLDFLRDMKNLKTFVFNMDVLDGDLTPCLDLSYVYSARNRKHFNLKDKDLPKGTYYRGNDNIEIWRRQE